MAHMCPCKVGDMKIIAYTGAIRGIIVVAEHLQLITQTGWLFV
jgi:hypothetical protein